MKTRIEHGPTVYARGVKRPRGKVGVVERAWDALPLANKDRAPRPWEARGSMAVDALLTWACRDQDALGLSRSGLNEIEAAVAGYFVPAASQWTRFETLERLGVRVDVSAVAQRRTVCPVAMAVGDAVARCEEAELVAHWARMGREPDGWREPARWFAPAIVEHDGAAGWVTWRSYLRDWNPSEAELRFVDHEASARAHVYPIAPVGSREGVEVARRVYVRWWDAVADLGWALSGMALGFAVTPLEVSREPWVEGA